MFKTKEICYSSVNLKAISFYLFPKPWCPVMNFDISKLFLSRPVTEIIISTSFTPCALSTSLEIFSR